MTWKEPSQIRQQSIWQHPDFQPNRLLKLVLLSLLHGPLFIAFCVVIIASPHRHNWQLYVSLALFISGFTLLVIIGYLGSIAAAKSIEGTFSLHSKGLDIRRGIFARRILWRSVINLEVAPHPTIENIVLLNFVLGQRLPSQFRLTIEKNNLLKLLYRLICQERIEVIPFEAGQIDVAEVFEIHRKYEEKRRKNKKP